MISDDSKGLTQLAERVRKYPILKPAKIMEVCGTHTVAIHRFGIQKLLPEGIRLVSGPGCPVCVTPESYIDEAVFLARQGFSIATFGDMVRVPGSLSSLELERAAGADIRVIYSPFEALPLARDASCDVVLLAVGFETTIPGIALTIQQAAEMKLKNFFVLGGNKLIPPAIAALLNSGSQVDGFLLPGHVSTIIGRSGYFEGIMQDFPAVIAGFEASDILSSLLILLEMIQNERSEIVNNYPRVVLEHGNLTAQAVMKETFFAIDSEWRGLGVINRSGLSLNAGYESFDIHRRVEIPAFPGVVNAQCRCGEVIKGVIDPPDCRLFSKVCTPAHPMGPCMISSEGSCGAWYNYG